MEGNSTLEEFGKNLACFRFVVLHHQLPAKSRRSSHWDLFLEQPPEWGIMLLSFEAPNSPLEWGPRTVIRKLPDHRSRYLDYEGPISDNRGSVRRVLEGHIQWLVNTPEFLTIRILPTSIAPGSDAVLVPQGVLEIRKNHGEANHEEWEMELLPPERRPSSFWTQQIVGEKREGEASAEIFTHQARQEPRTPDEIASNSKRKAERPQGACGTPQNDNAGC